MSVMRLLYLLIFFLPTGLLAKELNVCSDCEFQKIGAALKAAIPHSTIRVHEGLYKEHDLQIRKPINLLAEGDVTIDGEGEGTIMDFRTDSFRLSGFRIINVGHSFTKDYAAILVNRADQFSISENILENVFFGILLEKSHHGTIEKNKISSNAVKEAGSGNGIHLWHCSHMMVRENELHNLRDGIYFEFVTESFVIDNQSHDNLRYGLHFMFSNNDEYRDNTFSNNGAGVAVMFSKFIQMSENTFIDNWGAASYGLLLKEIYDAEIENNSFIRNTTAITVEGSTRINYRKNRFSNNGWAVKVTGACYENVFEFNDFLNNSFDLSYNSQLNDNRFENNYWSSYSGYDLDRDGVGDVPFRPVKLFSYVVNRTPETIVLLRSLFVDIINFSEKVSPVFTPDELQDLLPSMKPNR